MLLVSLICPPRDFYPRSPCGERLPSAHQKSYHLQISIHALLAESDNADYNYRSGHRYFYPRSPCGERPAFSKLLATLLPDFYPRSPCGERPLGALWVLSTQIFLSTLSLRRATYHGFLWPSRVGEISIHALLAESDVCILTILICTVLFLSTLSLRRATRVLEVTRNAITGFLSTLSLRRATARRALGFVDPDISIHALLAESDVSWFFVALKGRGNFYPRSPCGERRVHFDNFNLHCVISIHALLAESDIKISFLFRLPKNFYPRSPCGERLYRP